VWKYCFRARTTYKWYTLARSVHTTHVRSLRSMHVHTHVIRVYLSRIRKNQILRSIWRLRARFYWFRRRRPERPPSRKIFRRCPPSYVRRTIHMAIWSYQSRTEIYYLIIVITYITKNTLILSRKESCAVYVYLFARLHYYTGNNFCRSWKIIFGLTLPTKTRQDTSGEGGRVCFEK